jgi:hypothetical protein
MKEQEEEEVQGHTHSAVVAVLRQLQLALGLRVSLHCGTTGGVRTGSAKSEFLSKKVMMDKEGRTSIDGAIALDASWCVNVLSTQHEAHMTRHRQG